MLKVIKTNFSTISIAWLGPSLLLLMKSIPASIAIFPKSQVATIQGLDIEELHVILLINEYKFKIDSNITLQLNIKTTSNEIVNPNYNSLVNFLYIIIAIKIRSFCTFFYKINFTKKIKLQISISLKNKKNGTDVFFIKILTIIIIIDGFTITLLLTAYCIHYIHTSNQ